MDRRIEDARDAVNAIVERFHDPERASSTLTVSAALGHGLRTDVVMRKHEMTVDEPRSLGGTDEGPNPVQLVLAALASCQAITYRVWASKLGVALDAVHVEADGDIDLRGFYGVDDAVRAGFSAVRLRVRLDGPEPVDRYRELAEAVDAHCPVLDFTGNSIPFERSLSLGEDSAGDQ